MAAETLSSSASRSAAAAGPARGPAASSLGHFPKISPSFKTSFSPIRVGSGISREHSISSPNNTPGTSSNNFDWLKKAPTYQFKGSTNPDLRIAPAEVRQMDRVVKAPTPNPRRPLIDARNLFQNNPEFKLSPQTIANINSSDRPVPLTLFRGARRPPAGSAEASSPTTTKAESPKLASLKTESLAKSSETKLKQALSEIKIGTSDPFQNIQTEAKKPNFIDTKVGKRLTEVVTQVDKSTLSLDTKTATKIRHEVATRLQKDPQTFLKGEKPVTALPRNLEPAKNAPFVDQAIKDLITQAQTLKESTLSVAPIRGDQVQELTAKVAEVKKMTEAQPRSRVDLEVDQILQQIGLEPLPNARLEQLRPQPNGESQLDPKAAVQEAKRIIATRAQTQPEVANLVLIEQHAQLAQRTELNEIIAATNELLDANFTEDAALEMLVNSQNQKNILPTNIQRQILILIIENVQKTRKKLVPVVSDKTQEFRIGALEQAIEDSITEAKANGEDHISSLEVVKRMPNQLQTPEIQSPIVRGFDIDGGYETNLKKISEQGEFADPYKAFYAYVNILAENRPAEIVEDEQSNITDRELQLILNKAIQQIIQTNSGSTNLTKQSPALVG